MFVERGRTEQRGASPGRGRIATVSKLKASKLGVEERLEGTSKASSSLKQKKD